MTKQIINNNRLSASLLCLAFILLSTQGGVAYAQAALTNPATEAWATTRLVKPSTFDNLHGHPLSDNAPVSSDDSPQSGRRANKSSAPADASAKNAADDIFAPLYLKDVLLQVEAFHPKLRGADVERRIAAAKLLEKQGAFDPVLSVSSDYLRFNSTTTRGRLGIARQNAIEFEMPTRSGVKFIGGGRLNTGNVKSPLSSTGDIGEYYGGIKIPFMRDRGINNKAAFELQARLGEPLANAAFSQTRLDLLTNAANTYWEWVAAKRRNDVNARLYDLARLRVAQVSDRVQAGDLAPIDEIEAKQEVQRRLSSILKSALEFQKAALKLSTYLWADDETPAALPTALRVPDQFDTPELLSDELIEAARREAFARRPELAGININFEINDVELRLARNQRRPGLDVSFASGVDNGDRSIGPTMKFGVTLTLPFRRRAAEGLIAQAELKKQKLELDERNERLRIATEVSDALAQINAGYGRFIAAQEELQLAHTVERGERTRFEAGDSTLFLLNQRERATAEAEIKLVEVETDYRQAVVAFNGVSGRL